MTLKLTRDSLYLDFNFAGTGYFSLIGKLPETEDTESAIRVAFSASLFLYSIDEEQNDLYCFELYEAKEESFHWSLEATTSGLRGVHPRRKILRENKLVIWRNAPEKILVGRMRNNRFCTTAFNSVHVLHAVTAAYTIYSILYMYS